MEAIVLAGGLGTRLRSVVADLPKPLAPVAGRPFLAILLDDLARQGCLAVVLSVGYKHELIRAAFGHTFAGMEIRYAVEDRALGTGGAIKLAAQQCVEADIFVLNGDSYVEFDAAAMLAAHRAGAAQISVCTVPVADAGRYGSVVVEGDRLAGFLEKGIAGPGRINAGVYLIARDLIGNMSTAEVFSFERDVLAARLAELRPLAFPCSGCFIDIGIPEDYARAQQLFANS